MEERLKALEEEKDSYLTATPMLFPSVAFGDIHWVTAYGYSIIKWNSAFDNVLLVLKTRMGFNESHKINA